MEAHKEQAETTNALFVPSNSTGTIAFGPTLTSSSEQVTLQEPILNQSIVPLMHLAPKLTPNISIGI